MLWNSDLQFVSTACESEGDSVRRLEMFLDRVLAASIHPTAYFLDESYAALFDETEEGSPPRLLNSKQRLKRVTPRCEQLFHAQSRRFDRIASDQAADTLSDTRRQWRGSRAIRNMPPSLR